MDERDPVQQRSEGTLDLQDVTDWEARSALDRLSLRLYQGIKWGLQALLVALAVAILLGQFALGGLGAVTNPDIGVFVLLSAVPAFGLAAYIWYADVTTQEPLVLLVGTFMLGVLFAGFAGVLNVELSAVLDALGIGVIGFYFLVVGPVEESVKLLAVRLYAYRSARFDAVIDGAVYGAVAGLGFATIENAYYITSNIDTVSAGAITSVRALAGPGHVIYSAFAGYYLGLAKFNREHAGPIVLKGLLIAASIHGLYNVLSEFLPTALAAVLGVNWFFGFVFYVLLFDGVFGLVLLRKLQAYRRAYDIVHRRRSQPPESPE